ncbi:MAG TPA: FtsX-like permease family protein [Blastocatellia bacterium]|nr:FtsX-like permease family protein [Blastocatellia bacterium]
MLETLLFVGLREWRRHKLRAVIIVVSVAVGVSAYFAMVTTNQTLLASLEATVDRLSGKATLQVTAGDSGFSEEALETVRFAPGVTAATGVLQVFCSTGIKGKSVPGRGSLDGRVRLLIFGIDPDNEQKVRGNSYGGIARASGLLVFLRMPGTIVISSEFAKQQGLKAGDTLEVITPSGKMPLTILSVFSADGIGGLYGGRVGVMDIHSAQAVFGRDGAVDRIDIVTEPGVAIDSVREYLKQRLPSGLEVERPHQRSQEVEDGTRMMRQGFVLTSLFALLIGAFLIYNAMSISVNQRWKEIGILRALGARGPDIRRMFLYEAALIGIIGSLFGVAAGYAMAVQFSKISGSLSNYLASSLTDIVVPELPHFSALFALESIGIGVIASIISTWLPARSASKLDPTLALHNIETRRREALASWPRVALGGVLVASGVALIRFSPPRVGAVFQLVSIALIFAGFLVVLPRLSRWISAAMRPVADGVFGSEGVLAVDSITVAPRRTAATVGAMMAGLAFVFSNWATIQSSKATLLASVGQQINYDLEVWVNSPVTEDSTTGLASIPGVMDVDRIVGSTTRYRGQVAGFASSDMALWFRRRGNTLLEGDREKARELVPKGQGVLISKNFSSRWGLRVGDTLSLETPTARLERPVLGIVDYVAWFEGTIYMDRSLYKQYWRDSRVGGIGIYLKPGADADAVKRRIESTFTNEQLGFVMTAGEVKNRVDGIIRGNLDHLFAFFYVQMFIAGFVGVVGIVNTLVISVWDRKREIGIVRAIGGTRIQIVKMVLIEAAALGVIGLMTGGAKSIFDTYFMSRTAASVFVGYTIPFYFPGYVMVVSVPVVIALALAAAWWPARLAARTNVASAIASE